MTTAARLIVNLRKGSPAFAVTVLFAAVGWLITHAVDRVAKAPTVAYEVESEHKVCADNQPCRVVTLYVENLSEVVFSGVHLELNLPENAGKFLDKPKIMSAAPAWGATLGDPANDSLPITFEQFHPGARIEVTANVTGPTDPVLLLKNSGQAMRLVPASSTTYLVKHDITFLFLAVILLAGIVGAIVSGRLTEPIAVSLITAVFVAVVFLLL